MTVHKAKSIKTWFEELGVEELEWPAKSPAINPTGPIWAMLETQL